MAEPRSFRNLLVQQIAWQIKKLEERSNIAKNWGEIFRDLAKTAPYLPLHASLVSTFKVGDIVALKISGGYYRGTVITLKEYGRVGVEHHSTTGRTMVISTHGRSEILHMRDFEFLHANEKFAKNWLKECGEYTWHTCRQLRAGLKF